MFDPFGNLSQYYSMWSVILTTYNLPSWLCMKESSFMLTLLIPGLKSSGKDIDVYLRPLIDDLKDLWALKGVETIDVATGQKFNMRAIVLWTINDFPAQSSFVVKPQNGRWSLDFNGETENGDPPRKFDRVQIMSQLARLPTHVKGKHPRANFLTRHDRRSFLVGLRSTVNVTMDKGEPRLLADKPSSDRLACGHTIDSLSSVNSPFDSQRCEFVHAITRD
ncbi:hypothetical protein Tco_0135319 [Tanacetum coccineum]